MLTKVFRSKSKATLPGQKAKVLEDYLKHILANKGKIPLSELEDFVSKYLADKTLEQHPDFERMGTLGKRNVRWAYYSGFMNGVGFSRFIRRNFK